MTVTFITDYEQGSEAWFDLRLGSLGGSSVNGAIAAGAKGKTAKTLIRKLLAEKLTGKKAEFFKSEAMQTGNDREEESRDYLAFTEGIEIQQCALIKNDMFNGMHYSPDGYMPDSKGLVELKNPMGHTQIELLETGKISKNYIDQMQFGMLIAEYEYCIFCSYVPGIKPFIKRIEIDAAYQEKMMESLNVFFGEMKTLEEFISG